MTSNQIPLLFLGDSPTLHTGLARIGRDLALAASTLPQFRVAYLGRGDGYGGGLASSQLPFMQYVYQPTMADQWGYRGLPWAWRDWSRGQAGVIFTIWDASRLTWFGDPRDMGLDYVELYSMLVQSPDYAPFERWGYFAVDAMGPGPGGALLASLARTLTNYNRVLAYSQFGRDVLNASLQFAGEPLATTPQHFEYQEAGGVMWAPHGYSDKWFRPRPRDEARARLGLPDGAKLVGCVMSNQPRKDWGLWARTMQLVAREVPELRLWVHTDSLTRHWDLPALVEAYDLDRTIFTYDDTDDETMSWRYSACDLTVLPSLGEGFGYPIIESQACGVPVVHGVYGAGREFVYDADWLVEALPTTIIDTRHCLVRPVYEPEAWAAVVIDNLGYRLPYQPAIDSVAHLEWRKLWPRVWKPWFERGAEQFAAGRGARA